jgi:hypothetical protein
MSIESDEFVTVAAAIKPVIEDCRLLSIAERQALDLILEGLKDRNLRVLSLAESGRGRRKGKA